MFEILFGWRKASKCKRLLRLVQCRLKLLMNKRDSIVRQLREDIAELIQRGHEQSAFARVEQLCKDQNIKTAYGLIEHFCEFILINLPYIRRNRDCPNDINEAVSSLIFASARCGDLPELQKLRKLFGERYGQKFAMVATELLAGNLVNRQIIEKLSTKLIADDVRLGVMEEIARDKNLQLGSPEEDSKFGVEDHQVSDLLLKNCKLERVQQVPHRDNQFASIASDNRELRESSLFYDATIIDQQKQVANPCKSVADAIVLQTDADINKSAIELEKQEQQGPLQEMKRMAGAPSGSLSNFSERSVVYLDDITEFKPKTIDVVDKDQSLFMFDSTINKGCLSDLYCDGFTRDQIEPCEQSDGKTSSRGSSSSSRTRRRKLPRKRLKRRYQSSTLPALSMKNPEYSLYYGEPGDSYSTEYETPRQESHPQRKHQRKKSVEESLLISSFTANHRNEFKTSNKVCCCKLSHDVDNDCLLEHPCYLRTSDYKNDWEITSPRLHNGLVKTTNFPNKNSKRGAFKDENFRCHRSMDYETFSTTIPYNCKSYGNHRQFKEMEKVEVMDWQASCTSRDSCSSATSSSTQSSVNAKARLPYLRAVTMPPERPKGTSSCQILRSQSCLNNDSERSSPSSSCSHVHPKLPDYDDLAIKFKALKEELRQNTNGEVSSGGIRRA